MGTSTQPRSVPFLIAATASIFLSGAAAPEWKKPDLKALLNGAQSAARAPSVQAQDELLAQVIGQGYRVQRMAGESLDLYSKRVAMTRDPEHPSVRTGQWLSAAARLFYTDVADRAESLVRFETDRADRALLDRMAKDARQTASVIARSLEVAVEGLDGFFEPLPSVPGAPAQAIGAMAELKGDALVVERLERARFVNDRPVETAERTPHGALKEIYSSLKQFGVSAEMLGMYETKWRQGRGNVRVVLPARAPALYLNELVRGAKEAQMHTLRLLTTRPKTGELNELVVRLSKPSADKARGRGGKKGKGAVEVRELSCPDETPMQLCAEKIAHGLQTGTVVYRVEG